MYKIKQISEDFIVTEELKLDFGDGKYSYYKLKKKDYNTLDAIARIARAFHMNSKYINFAGTKDRNAITTQYISISNGPKKGLKQKNLVLEFLGRGKNRIALGDNTGNNFEIVVRNIEQRPQKIDKIINLFDDQRFGRKKNNHLIGKAIVKKDFKLAVELIDEVSLKNYLKEHLNDFVGALKTMHKKILLLYVHAYQSYLWNMIAKEKWDTSAEKNIEVPLIGFDTEITPEISKLLQRENIEQRDFLIRQIPQLSLQGSSRKMFADVKKLSIGLLFDDELNPGMKKVTVRFFLGKGSYATQVIKQMIHK